MQRVGAEGLEALRHLCALLHEGGGDLYLALGHVAEDGEHGRRAAAPLRLVRVRVRLRVRVRVRVTVRDRVRVRVRVTVRVSWGCEYWRTETLPG